MVLCVCLYSMVYIMKYYYHENLDDMTSCNEYFEGQFLYGYPNHQQSVVYCQAFRWTTILGLLLFIFMHFQVGLCVYVYMSNQKQCADQLSVFWADEGKSSGGGGYGGNDLVDPLMAGIGYDEKSKNSNSSSFDVSASRK